MFFRLGVFPLVVLLILCDVHPNAVGRFDQVVPEVNITALGQGGFFPGKSCRLVFFPGQAGKLGKGIIAGEVFDIPMAMIPALKTGPRPGTVSKGLFKPAISCRIALSISLICFCRWRMVCKVEARMRFTTLTYPASGKNPGLLSGTRPPQSREK